MDSAYRIRAMYILVPIILILCRKKRKRYSFAFVSVITVVLCCLQMVKLLYHPEWRCVIYGTDIWAAMELIPWYLIGVIHFSMYAEIVKYSGKYFGSLPVVLSEPRIAYLCILKYVTFSYTIFSLHWWKNRPLQNAFRRLIYHMDYIYMVFCAADRSISV